MISCSMSSNSALKGLASVSVSLSAKASFASSRTAFMAVERFSLPFTKQACSSFCMAHALISAPSVNEEGFSTRGSFFLPAAAASSIWILHSSRIVTWARSMASMISSSGTCRAPPSTIVMPRDGARDDDIDAAFEDLVEGRVDHELAVHVPDAHRADGPLEGDVGDGDRGRGRVHRQDVGGVHQVGGDGDGDDLDLARNSLENRGLIGLSMSRETRTSLSLGLPSRLMNPPGILPAA